jgi:hypothetical protein
MFMLFETQQQGRRKEPIITCGQRLILRTRYLPWPGLQASLLPRWRDCLAEVEIRQMGIVAPEDGIAGKTHHKILKELAKRKIIIEEIVSSI